MRTKSISAITSFVAILLTAQNAYAQHAADVGPIQIGSILILSGEGASWGTSSRNGINMAIDRVNAEGGVLGRRLEVIHQDDQGDAKSTLSAFRQLTDVLGIKYIIGPTWSTLGIPLIEAADRKGIVMISPTLGMAKFNESSRFLFNTWPHDFILSEKLAEHVYAKGHRKVAIIGAEEVWVKEQTEAFKRRFQELGGTIALALEPLPGARELSNEALQIKSSGADALISTTDGVIVGSLVAKRLREMKSSMPIYSVTIDQAAIDAARGGFEGAELLTFLTPKPDFKASYEARYSTTIDVGADSAYDAAMLLVEAMRRAASTDPELVAKELAGVKEYDGVSGKLVSDGKRGFTKAGVARRIVNGKAVALPDPKEAKDAAAAPQ